MSDREQLVHAVAMAEGDLANALVAARRNPHLDFFRLDVADARARATDARAALTRFDLAAEAAAAETSAQLEPEPADADPPTCQWMPRRVPDLEPVICHGVNFNPYSVRRD